MKKTQRKRKKKAPAFYFPVSIDSAEDIVDECIEICKQCIKIAGYLRDALQEHSEQVNAVNAKDGQDVN